MAFTDEEILRATELALKQYNVVTKTVQLSSDGSITQVGILPINFSQKGFYEVSDTLILI